MESREASREVSAAVWTEILTRVAPQGGGRRFVLVGKTAGPTGEAVLAALAAAGIPALSVAGQTSFDDLFHLAQAAAGRSASIPSAPISPSPSAARRSS